MKPEEIATVQEPSGLYGSDYTYADYVTWTFDEMVEIIKGRVFRMSPTPGATHQSISRNISGFFWSFLKDRKCEVFTAPFDVILPIKNKKRDRATTVVQPDVCVVCNPNVIEERGCFGVPDLIIEIISPFIQKRSYQQI